MISLAALNALSAADFTATLGGIFEHSPWVAEQVASERPFAAVDALHAAMVAAVDRAGAPAQLALLRAHPVLAPPRLAPSRLAPSGPASGTSLTAASASEQASHGLTSLDDAEATRFAAANEAYQARFGFPFIIAVRGQRDRAAILAALQARSTATPEAEHATALAEIAKIARFRLDYLIEAAGWLSVHVLDTARGTPGAGMDLTLDRLTDSGAQRLGAFRTNADGRCDTPLLHGPALLPGLYEITFAVGAWRQARNEAEQGFYDQVPIRFCIEDTRAHYHVPLLVAPFGYSTYRGS